MKSLLMSWLSKDAKNHDLFTFSRLSEYNLNKISDYLSKGSLIPRKVRLILAEYVTLR